MNGNLRALPLEIRQTQRAVIWRQEVRAGKITKVPYRPDRPLEHAAVNDPATWSSFEQALAACEADTKNGPGIVLGEGLVGVDLDQCRNPETGYLTDAAQAIVTRLGSYTEVSPSGTGVHILLRGTLPPGRRRHGNLEMYADGRYFTLTGIHLVGTPWRIHERSAALAAVHAELLATPEQAKPQPDALIVKACGSKFGPRFRALWAGDTSDYGGDDSAADMALCNMLVFWTHADAWRVDRLFRQSGLMRPKWDEWRGAQTYGALTIAKAIALEPNKHTMQAENNLSFKYSSCPPTVEYVLRAKDTYDGWFLRGCVSLIGGTSGSGKTTLMTAMLHTQASGDAYLGHQGGGLEYLLLFADRGALSNQLTLQRMGLAESGLKIAYVPVCWGLDAVQHILDAIEACPIRPAAVLVEGADCLVEEPNSVACVAAFLAHLQKIATHYHIAIILSVGAPKTKPKEQYEQKRDRIFGSQIWSRMSETVALLSYSEDTERRQLDILHRNCGGESFQLCFHKGLLVEAAPPSSEQERSALRDWSQDVEKFRFRTARKAFPKLSRSRLAAALSTLVQAGVLQRSLSDDIVWYHITKPGTAHAGTES